MWYHNYTEDSLLFKYAMIDVDGRFHRNTLFSYKDAERCLVEAMRV